MTKNSKVVIQVVIHFSLVEECIYASENDFTFRADHDLLRDHDLLNDRSNKKIMRTGSPKFQKWLSKWLSILIVQKHTEPAYYRHTWYEKIPIRV